MFKYTDCMEVFMEKTFYRIFPSKTSECKWLNKLGNMGYLLKTKSKGKYVVELEKDKRYYYSIEYIDMAPESSDAKAYIESREANGEYIVALKRHWAYFRKVGSEIELTADAYKMNCAVYFWRMLYLYYFAVCSTVVCGYQAFAIGFLERVSLETSGQIREFLVVAPNPNFFQAIINLFRRLINSFLELLNVYFALCAKLFGESDAVSVIAILAPLAVLLYVLGAINLDKYIQNKIGVKKNAK